MSFLGISVEDVLKSNYLPIAIGGALILVSVPILWKRFNPLRPSHVDVSKYPRDKVILFQIPRGPFAPSMSPYMMKLETYLRMAKIPYQNVFGFTMSERHKPWLMLYDGQVVADFHFAILHLNRVRGVNLSKALTEEQRAVAWAFQTMLEDHMFWPIVMWRWIFNFEKPEGRRFMSFGMGYNNLWLKLSNNGMKKVCCSHGIGYNTKEEINTLIETDLRRLSAFLGDKSFLMGSEPCEEDCAVWAHLAQEYWHTPLEVTKGLFMGDCANLAAYCERMKERFWPDWDDCITHGGTRKATK